MFSPLRSVMSRHVVYLCFFCLREKFVFFYMFFSLLVVYIKGCFKPDPIVCVIFKTHMRCVGGGGWVGW